MYNGICLGGPWSGRPAIQDTTTFTLQLDPSPAAEAQFAKMPPWRRKEILDEFCVFTYHWHQGFSYDGFTIAEGFWVPEGVGLQNALRDVFRYSKDQRVRDYEEAYQYALNLADSLHQKHYPDVTEWRPLGELVGLLTQIDNMVASLQRIPE